METSWARAGALGFLVAAVVLLGGCETARETGEAERFAAAGQELTGTLPDLYDEYFAAAVIADSAVLERTRARQDRGREDLRRSLADSDDDFRETLALLAALKTHAALLEDYFVALRELAAGGAGVGEATADVVRNLKAVRLDVADRRFLGVSVASAAEGAGSFTVARLKNRALDEELEAHGQAIDAELAVQEALVAAIVRNLKAHREAQVVAERNRLYTEFETRERSLPRSWSDDRVLYLARSIDMTAAEAATAAMANLRSAWRELAAGGADEATIDRLIRNVKAAQSFVRRLKTA